MQELGKAAAPGVHDVYPHDAVPLQLLAVRSYPASTGYYHAGSRRALEADVASTSVIPSYAYVVFPATKGQLQGKGNQGGQLTFYKSNVGDQAQAETREAESRAVLQTTSWKGSGGSSPNRSQRRLLAQQFQRVEHGSRAVLSP